MKKMMALVLAMAMAVSLSVTAFAGAGIYASPVLAWYNDSGDWKVSRPTPEETNQTTETEFNADATLVLKRSVHAPAGVFAGVETLARFNHFAADITGKTAPQFITSVTTKNGVLSVRKCTSYRPKYFNPDDEVYYELEPAQPCAEVGKVLEDVLVVKTNGTVFRPTTPATYEFPVMMTMTDAPWSDGNASAAASSDDEPEPAATENIANDPKTTQAIEQAMAAIADPSEKMPSGAVKAATAAGKELTVIPVKLTSGDALSTDTMELLGRGSSSVGLQAKLSRMTVTIPGGFGQITEKGRISYPLIYEEDPASGDAMKAAVKDGKSEAVKAGGDMRMPADVTVSLKTRLTGSVNVYYYNELTRKFTLLGTATPENGWLTFATRQMGNLLLTTGAIR